MRSIKRRLFVWLLGALGLLWVGVGLGVFLVLQKSFYATFDADLQVLISGVRFLLADAGLDSVEAGSQSRNSDWIAFFVADSGQYFAVWDEDLLFSDTSPSLESMELDPPQFFSSAPQFMNTHLSNGEPVRTIARQVKVPAGASNGEYALNMMVALNRVELDAQCRTMLLAVLGVGALVLILSAAAIHAAVGWGLRPLVALGGQVADVDADSLHQRFSPEYVPVELGEHC